MHEVPDPEWYADYVLAEIRPDGRRLTPNAVADWRGWWRVQARLLAENYPFLAARAQGFVVLSTEVRTGGVPRHVNRRRIRTGEWSSPQHDVLA